MSAPKPHTQSGAGPSDAALVVAARAGEDWALEALFRRYARMVNGMAFRLMGRDADVDDLVQDAYLQAFKSLGSLASEQAFGSWLGSIVVRTAHKRLRRRALRARLGFERATPIDADAIVSSAAPPDVAAELRQIYAALDRMPASARVALVLRRVEGMTLPEVAAAMNASLTTVKRRLRDAERHLEAL